MVYAFFVFIFAVIIVTIIVSYNQNKYTPPEYEDENEIDIIDATPQLTESYLTFNNIIGQEKTVEYIKGHIDYAKKKGKPLPHLLLWGNGGLGKSTLVKAISKEMGGRYIEVLPANLKTTKELFTILFRKLCSCGFENPFNVNSCLVCKGKITNYFTPIVSLQENDVLFIEEVHGLNTAVEETMYSLMQDGYMVVRYNGADQMVQFPNITVAGATTQLGDLNRPFRDRFRILAQLVPYTEEQIKKIVTIYSNHYGLLLTDEVRSKIATISYGIPRIAKKYIEDIATIADEPVIKDLEHLLGLLGVDSNGLNEVHRNMMKYILLRMQGMKNGAAGAAAIASAAGVPKNVYEEALEPPLLYHEFIYQSSRGRRLTDKCLKEYFPEAIGTIKT